MKYLNIIIWTLLIPSINLLGIEKADTTKQSSYISFGMSNDLLQNREKSDKYFSAAFTASYFSSTLDNNIARKLLVGFNEGYNIFGLTASQSGFTPDNLSLSKVDSTDRPYCGVLTLQYGRYSTDNKSWRLQSALKLGVSGPASFTENVQKGIHEATGSTPPMGWDNQIANSLIIDYYVKGEMEFLQHKEHLRLGLNGYGEIGTFATLAGFFGDVKLGWFNNDFTSYKGLAYKQNGKRKWQLYCKMALGSRMVLYDGTLQGGLIPFDKSPYTYSFSDYQHITAQFIYKITFSYKNFKATYTNVVEGNRYFIDDFFSFGNITLTVPFSH